VAAGTGIWVREAVGVGEEVAMNVCVAVAAGGCVNVGGTDVNVAVEEGKTRVMVTPGIGVRVGMFGTHNLCPA
jgi:hypothetical protein